ncbi:MAG: hypothetical protein AAGE90_02165 [Pseudomonadota bacterium]
MAEQTTLIVNVFYALTLAKLYMVSDRYIGWGGDFQNVELLWPLWWTGFVDQQRALFLLASLSLVAGTLGLFWWRALWVRIFVSVMLLLLAAFNNQGGTINHSSHEWLWVSVAFWFLPSGSPNLGLEDRLWRVRLMLAFAGAGGLIMMFYALSGMWKVIEGLEQVVAGEFGGLHPDAMAVTIARRAMQTGTSPLLAELIIAVPWAGWPLYLGLYYVEIVALVVIFRPELVRLWGAILIAFHLGTLAFLDIIFVDHVVINALLFWLAPWAVKRPGWREMAVALPVFGMLLRQFLSSPSAPARGGAAPASGRV